MSKEVSRVNLEILTSLSDTERRHFFSMLFNKIPNPVGVGFRIISQRPADSLVNEEF